MLKKALLIILCVFSLKAHAEELTDEKRGVIDELLEVTGVLGIGDLMGASISNELIRKLSQQNKTLDPKVLDILRDESKKIMHDEFIANQWLNEMSHKVYHKHFSLLDLKNLVAFYQTTTGRKVIKAMPRIIQESMVRGQAHGRSLGPVIRERLRARFEREGVESPLEE